MFKINDPIRVSKLVDLYNFNFGMIIMEICGTAPIRSGWIICHFKVSLVT